MLSFSALWLKSDVALSDAWLPPVLLFFLHSKAPSTPTTTFSPIIVLDTFVRFAVPYRSASPSTTDECLYEVLVRMKISISSFLVVALATEATVAQNYLPKWTSTWFSKAGMSYISHFTINA